VKVTVDMCVPLAEETRAEKTTKLHSGMMVQTLTGYSGKKNENVRGKGTRMF